MAIRHHPSRRPGTRAPIAAAAGLIVSALLVGCGRISPLPWGAGDLRVPFGRTADTEWTPLTIVVDLEREVVVRILRDGRIEWGPGTS